MVEEESVLDTPFIRQIRADVQRENILETIVERFDPSVKTWQTLKPQLEEQLEQIADLTLLRNLFTQALRADTLDEIIVAIETASGEKDG